MIKEEDIKVGNFVVMDEEISVDTGCASWYKHKARKENSSTLCGCVYISGSPTPSIFKITSCNNITSVNGGVTIEPTQKILYFSHEECKAFAMSVGVFKANFTLYCGDKEQVSHPSHYAWLKDLCGIEPLDICRHLDFNTGNAIKYLLRKDKVERNLTEKEQRIQDLEKAKFYIEDEIKLLEHGKENV